MKEVALILLGVILIQAAALEEDGNDVPRPAGREGRQLAGLGLSE